MATLSWDRGTLLVEAEDAEALPGVLWDPRVRGWRAPAWRYRDLAPHVQGALVDAGEIRSVAPPSLRPYQEAALMAWEASGRRGVVVLPTGAGKTRLAVAAMARTGLAALVVAPTRALVQQWRRALEEAGFHGVGQVGDGVRDVRRVTVATAASARSLADRLGARFALLVIDEVHHHAGEDETLELYAAPARLGLTATPPEQEAQRARLTQLVGPVVSRAAVDDLAGRWLAPFDVLQIPLELTREEARAYHADATRFRGVYAAWARSAPDTSWVAFVGIATRTAQGRLALAAWQRARRLVAWTRAKRRVVGELLVAHARSRVLVFTRDNATAYAVARDHLVAPLTCDIGKAERDAVLARFSEGSLRALVSARVLNEGIDVPEADVALITGGSHGSREYVQRVGRVLRPVEGKQALVVELVMRDTHEVRDVARGRDRLAAR